MEPPEPGQGSGLRYPRAPIVSGGTLVVVGALAAACGLAWWWLARTGGGGMDMAAASPPEIWSVAYLLPAFVMWAVMMVAMMVPSASPMILLFARVPRAGGRAVHVSLFAAAYLAVWTLFSAAASIAQALLVASGLITDATLAIGSRALAGGLLVAAGLYQLSPLKAACLDACRSPLAFLLRLSRPGVAGTLRLGIAHGAYCLGCCWALMLLLFVGGVMNLAWIAAIALLVFAEKAAPVPLSRVLAVLLVTAGALLVLSDAV